MSGRHAFVQDALKPYAHGDRLYNGSRLRASAQAFRRASRVARAIGSEDGEDIEDKSRFWLGVSLHGTGRVKEALAAWAPILNHLRDRPMNADRYRALTRYVLGAVDIPLPLTQIEAAFSEVESHIHASAGGASGLRSRLLLARARLALNRGDTSAGLEYAEEAVVRGLREPTSYSTSTYFHTVIRACLEANEIDLIPGYLQDWATNHDSHPGTKRLLLAAGRADYLRQVGEHEDAMRAIAPLRAEILSCEDVGFRIGAGSARVRAMVGAGVLERAREVLACLGQGRHNPIGEVRFQTRLLMAERSVRLGRDGGGGHLEKARRALGAAGREAELLDSVLQCGRHVREVEGRMEHAT